MGKTFKQLPKETLAKPVTKTITKLQRFRKVASVARRIKKKNGHELKPEKPHNEEIEDYEEEENEENFENDQEVEEAEGIPEEEKHEEGNMEIEENDEDNTQKSNRPLTNLIKVMNPILESGAIYTGGKIYLSPENDLYCLCNSEIIIYSLETHTIKKKITQENEEIANFVVHPTHKSIVFFTKNFLVRHISLEDNSVLRLWKVQNQYVLDMAIDTTGRLLATGATTGVIQIFDLKKGNTTHMYTNNKGPIVKLEFHPQPQKLYLISLAEDLSLRVYDLVVNACVKTFQNFQQSPSCFTLLDDGINVLTSSYDLKINLYDLQQLSHRTSFNTDEEIAAIENIKVTIPKTKEVQTFLLIGGQSGVLKTLNLALDEPVIKHHDYIKTEQIVKILKFKKIKRIALITSEQNIIILSYFINADGELEFAMQSTSWI